MKFLFALLFSLFTTSVFCQYLEPRFQDKTVYMQVVSNGRYATNDPSGGTVPWAQTKIAGFDKQAFAIESISGKPNWYKIRHTYSNKYICISTAAANQYVYLQTQGGYLQPGRMAVCATDPNRSL